jgi:hypothetical protein
MAIGTIQVDWTNPPGYSIKSQPSSMTEGDTLNVVPPAEGCTMNFSPSIPLSTDPNNPLASYTFSGTAKNFTMPNVQSGTSYNFNFSVDGYQLQPRVDGRSIPINKT